MGAFAPRAGRCSRAPRRPGRGGGRRAGPLAAFRYGVDARRGARAAGVVDEPSGAHSLSVCVRASRAGWVRASALGSWGLLAPRPLGDFLHVKKVTKVPLKGRPQGLPLRISFPLRSMTETWAQAARPTASPLSTVGSFDGRRLWLRWRGRDALDAVPRPGIAVLCRLPFVAACAVSAGEAWVRCTKRLSWHTCTVCVLTLRVCCRQARR